MLPEYDDLDATALAELVHRGDVHPRELVDAAILIGTDFNAGVKGIGPKTALKLIRQHRRIEELPPEIRARVAPHYQAVRDLYRSPDVTEDYQLEWSPPDEEGLCDFLCRERAFSEDRVRKAVALMNSRGVGEGRPA